MRVGAGPAGNIHMQGCGGVGGGGGLSVSVYVGVEDEGLKICNLVLIHFSRTPSSNPTPHK